MEKDKEKYILPISILVAALIIGGVIAYINKSEKSVEQEQSSTKTQVAPPQNNGGGGCGV